MTVGMLERYAVVSGLVVGRRPAHQHRRRLLRQVGVRVRSAVLGAQRHAHQHVAREVDRLRVDLEAVLAGAASAAVSA